MGDTVTSCWFFSSHGESWMSCEGSKSVRHGWTFSMLWPPFWIFLCRLALIPFQRLFSTSSYFLFPRVSFKKPMQMTSNIRYLSLIAYCTTYKYNTCVIGIYPPKGDLCSTRVFVLLSYRLSFQFYSSSNLVFRLPPNIYLTLSDSFFIPTLSKAK